MKFVFNPFTGKLDLVDPAASGMIYPGTGIPLSTGAGWDTSITNNSANWNIAYGWGNHASAGYLTASSVLDPSKVTQSITYRFVTDAQVSAWNAKQDAGSYLTDAPSDGTTYGRKNANWAAVPSSTGISAELAIAYAIAL